MGDKKLTFDHVGGLEVQKRYLKTNIIDILANPGGAKAIGLEPPKGILFYGVPGSGKTLLANAFANELTEKLHKKVTFIFRKGGDVFTPWFGESSKNLRKVFDEAKLRKPSIIFFDELDGLCPSRERALHTSQAYATVVTTFLGLMDNLPKGEVFVIGATNRLESIDPAVLRPGRMDKKMVFLPPDEPGRKKIININLENWESSKRPADNYINQLAKQTMGFTGADLQKLCRDAFFEAFYRHNPGRGIDEKKLNVNNLKVLERDWEASFKKIIPTETNTYGSLLHIPKAIPLNAVPLVQVNTQNIINIVELKEPIVSEGRSLYGKIAPVVSSVLIFDNFDKTGHVLDNLIMPNVLGYPKLTKFPVYMINKETAGTPNYLDAVKQAANFAPSILVILRVDRLNDGRINKADSLYKELNHFLRGKPVLVIATAAHTVDIQSPALKSLFQDELLIDNETPSDKERETFFRPIFMEKLMHVNDEGLKAQTLKQTEKEAEKLLQHCVESTKKCHVSSLLDLYAVLNHECSTCFNEANKDNLVSELTNIINKW